MAAKRKAALPKSKTPLPKSKTPARRKAAARRDTALARRSTTKEPARAVEAPGGAAPARLVRELGQLIDAARTSVTQTANAALTTLYWELGARIGREVLRGRPATCGAEIVAALGRELATRFGRGFEEKNLRRMVQFTEAFPDPQIVATLRRQLSWSHFKRLVPIEDPLEREFYAEMCRAERWSTRTLQAKLDGMLYQRTALSKRPDRVIRQELAALRDKDEVTPDLVFQDPYLLDFLGLRDTYSERDLEAALLRKIDGVDAVGVEGQVLARRDAAVAAGTRPAASIAAHAASSISSQIAHFVAVDRSRAG